MMDWSTLMSPSREADLPASMVGVIASTPSSICGFNLTSNGNVRASSVQHVRSRSDVIARRSKSVDISSVSVALEDPGMETLTFSLGTGVRPSGLGVSSVGSVFGAGFTAGVVTLRLTLGIWKRSKPR